MAFGIIRQPAKDNTYRKPNRCTILPPTERIKGKHLYFIRWISLKWPNKNGTLDQEKMGLVPSPAIISAEDNDTAGESYNQKLTAAFADDLLIDLPCLKDYNEVLRMKNNYHFHR